MTPADFEGPPKRWYDEYNNIRGAIGGIETLPEEFQTIIAAGINLMAEKNLSAEEALRCLGKDKITALFKSKRKQRSYDHNTELHKTMNYLLALPDENKEELGDQFYDLTATVVEYVADCISAKKEPRAVEVDMMTRVFVESQGSKEAVKAYVHQLHPEFDQKPWEQETPSQETSAEEPAPPRQENLVSEDGGMKIRMSDY